MYFPKVVGDSNYESVSALSASLSAKARSSLTSRTAEAAR